MSIVNPVDLVLGVRSMCRSQEEDASSTVSRIRCRADPALTLVSLDSAGRYTYREDLVTNYATYGGS